MKKLILILVIILTSLLITRVAWSLPNCSGKWSASSWHNCVGSYTWGKGSQHAGDKYVGEHWYGKMQGWGTYYISKSGAKYVGEFWDNLFHGQGTFYYSNGDKYVGEWKNDLMHGKGTYTFRNGDKLSGTFKYNKFIN